MSPLYKDTGRAGSGPTLVTPFILISSEKLGFPTKATLSGTGRQDLGIFCGAKFTPRRTPLLTGHQPNAAPLSSPGRKCHQRPPAPQEPRLEDDGDMWRELGVGSRRFWKFLSATVLACRGRGSLWKTVLEESDREARSGIGGHSSQDAGGEIWAEPREWGATRSSPAWGRSCSA